MLGIILIFYNIIKMNFNTCTLGVKGFLPLLGNSLFYEEFHVSMFFKIKIILVMISIPVSYINETGNSPHKTH